MKYKIFSQKEKFKIKKWKNTERKNWKQRTIFDSMKKRKKSLPFILLIIFLFTLPSICQASSLIDFFGFNFETYDDGELVGQEDWTGDTGAYSVGNSSTYYYGKSLYVNHMTASYKSIEFDNAGFDDGTGTESITFYISPKDSGGSSAMMIFELWNKADSAMIMRFFLDYSGGTTWHFNASGSGNIYGTNTVQEGEWTKHVFTIDWDTPTISVEGFRASGESMGTYNWTGSYLSNLVGIGKFDIDVYDAQAYIEGFKKPTLTWEGSDPYEYEDEIKGVHMLWHEWDASGHIFGIGVDIQNNFETWDSMLLTAVTPSINDVFYFGDDIDTSYNFLRPNLIIDSTDYQAYWPAGVYDLTLTLYAGAVPEGTPTEIELNITEVRYERTEAEWEEITNHPYVVSEGESNYPMRGPLQAWLYSFTQKFPISWVIGIVSLWNEKQQALESREAEGDNLSLTWTLPELSGTATAFSGAELPVINMTGARSTYSSFFSTVRTILIYIFWLVGISVILLKAKNLINSLGQK